MAIEADKPPNISNRGEKINVTRRVQKRKEKNDGSQAALLDQPFKTGSPSPKANPSPFHVPLRPDDAGTTIIISVLPEMIQLHLRRPSYCSASFATK